MKIRLNVTLKFEIIFKKGEETNRIVENVIEDFEEKVGISEISQKPYFCLLFFFIYRYREFSTQIFNF